MHLFLFLAASAAGTLIGGPVGDRIGRKPVIWGSILGVAPFALALPHVDLAWTTTFTILIGLILSSAFSAILVYAQELIPGKVGAVSGCSSASRSAWAASAPQRSSANDRSSCPNPRRRQNRASRVRRPSDATRSHCRRARRCPVRVRSGPGCAGQIECLAHQYLILRCVGIGHHHVAGRIERDRLGDHVGFGPLAFHPPKYFCTVDLACSGVTSPTTTTVVRSGR
jgi:hypothetical protein